MIIRIFLCLHHFPEENDETQATSGGKKNLTPLFIYLIRHQKFVVTLCNL